MRLQGRLLAIPWLSGVIAHTGLAFRSKPFMKYAIARAADRLKNGNGHGGKDFLHHMASFFSLLVLDSTAADTQPSAE